MGRKKNDGQKAKTSEVIEKDLSLCLFFVLKHLSRFDSDVVAHATSSTRPSANSVDYDTGTWKMQPYCERRMGRFLNDIWCGGKRKRDIHVADSPDVFDSDDPTDVKPGRHAHL
jgi:hypothetical protein